MGEWVGGVGVVEGFNITAICIVIFCFGPIIFPILSENKPLNFRTPRYLIEEEGQNSEKLNMVKMPRGSLG